MDMAARLTSRGRLTVPKPVRDAFELRQGDLVVFRLEGRSAVVARGADLIDLAGSVPVPVAKRGAPWNELRRETRAVRAQRGQ